MKKVVKFGGSSLASARQFKKVADIIKSDKSRRYVVPSAPGKRSDKDEKVTDLLYACYDAVAEGRSYKKILEKIKSRYMDIIDGLDLNLNLDHEFDRIEENFLAKAGRDYAASRGEYLNGIVAANFLGFEFVDAAEVIFFDENGNFESEHTNRELSERLEHVEKAVIPGFYGSKPDGTIKTFSRGGSDVTGSIVAKAIHADMYENWTDVSGFLMADPRIVKNSKPIHKISYKELRELSYMGASVLHDEAIYPARMANIPINIRNTNHPEDPGTIITAEQEETTTVVTGIAGSKDFTVIAIYKNMMSYERGFVRRILAILEDFDISFEHLPSGIDTVSVVVSNKSIDGRLDELLDAFEKQLNPDTMEVFEDISLIATVGCGMSRRSGVAASLFTALADADVNIRMIDQGSSEMNIIVGVENKDFEKAVRAIYNAFA